MSTCLGLSRGQEVTVREWFGLVCKDFNCCILWPFNVMTDDWHCSCWQVKYLATTHPVLLVRHKLTLACLIARSQQQHHDESKHPALCYHGFFDTLSINWACSPAKHNHQLRFPLTQKACPCWHLRVGCCCVFRRCEIRGASLSRAVRLLLSTCRNHAYFQANRTRHSTKAKCPLAHAKFGLAKHWPRNCMNKSIFFKYV